jgi:serine-type D-Ala-D-Ala carboxypeptidase (penicillin-binding protein 5/6)
MNPKNTALIQFIVLAIAVALFLLWLAPKKAAVVTDSLIATGTTTHQLSAFPETPIEARSAYVYDARDGKILYEKEASVQMPLASLTKLMTALTASTLIPEYMLVRISVDDIREEGDTGLYVDEEWNVDKLIDYSLITSSNDGIRSIAAVAGSFISSTSTAPIQLFIDRMNSMARKIGLRETYFINQSGLDISKNLSGGYGSARDIARLVEYIIKYNPRLLEATSYAHADVPSKLKSHPADNTNKAIRDIPNLLASKTGFTDLSGGNVVIAFNAGLNHPIIISVLGSSYEGRFEDVSALASSTLVYFSRKAQ